MTDKVQNHYILHDNVLFRRKVVNTTDWKVMIPRNITDELIQDYHEQFHHTRQKKTKSVLKEHLVHTETREKSGLDIRKV